MIEGADQWVSDMSEVLAEDVEGIRFLVLNRPQKLNSLTVGLFTALLARVEATEASDAVRCVVLKGAGRRERRPWPLLYGSSGARVGG
jgi:enoyl-CoA hydratase/carnithine racemase